MALVAASLSILGGQAVQARRIVDGFADDPDVDCRFVPIDPTPRGAFARLRDLKYIRTLATQLCYWPLLFRQLRAVDVVHVFSASYTSFLLAPLPAIAVARLLRRPVVLNYHSGEAEDHLRRSWFARHVLRTWVDQIVVPSPYLAEVFARAGLRADVVPNVIDPDRFPFRARVPLRPRLLSTRNLEPLYNVACTLRAFARVQREHPEASLTLVGSGSAEPALRALATRLGLRHVEWVGRVAPADMPRHYAEADIYVQTPDIDNMPLSVLEAFCSGLPVVATRIGGVPVLLTDGVHGLLAPGGDDEAVAGAILRVLREPDLARARAAAARERCDAFTWGRVRDRWVACYRSVGHSGTSHSPGMAARVSPEDRQA